MIRNTPERILARVTRGPECWAWTGAHFRSGYARIKDAGARLVSQDDYGKLWRLDQPQDEPLVMVEMVNSSPEPDGSFRTYFERVHPDVRTPLDALAWQAELSPAEYALIEAQS